MVLPKLMSLFFLPANQLSVSHTCTLILIFLSKIISSGLKFVLHTNKHYSHDLLLWARYQPADTSIK